MTEIIDPAGVDSYDTAATQGRTESLKGFPVRPWAKIIDPYGVVSAKPDGLCEFGGKGLPPTYYLIPRHSDF